LVEPFWQLKGKVVCCARRVDASKLVGFKPLSHQKWRSHPHPFPFFVQFITAQWSSQQFNLLLAVFFEWKIKLLRFSGKAEKESTF
jgi:hypothetical protein